ncbi:hypothetical protein GCM10011504_48410 [Siccirubricoccus deserti]|uniref:Uncharacterized protein n=1 Tax=Siccirubricoccus deserti TaxID=2013562 RepID=A0A9X0UFY2_9PROT|nr:hypothetical protein [Siccirubricoccus deserti]MBC4018358.1 hypothetical protein [Siccirubricoccus deserti]GGC64579.1 hypothetical protein GCM10011504_48410 [Siccirubricoccus deserti]
MPSTEGTILLVQESRFRLLDARGRGRVFVLAAHAPLGPQDLPVLAGRRVRVEYEQAPGLLAGIARDLWMLDQGEARP